MREFTLGHLSESRSAPGGRQLLCQATNLTFESACICCYYRPNIHQLARTHVQRTEHSQVSCMCLKT